MHNLEIKFHYEHAVARSKSSDSVDTGVEPRAPLKILYIHHADTLGGSSVSLLYTLQALDPGGYDKTVVLIRPTAQVAAFFRTHGIRVVEEPRIKTFEHTTASSASLTAPRVLVQFLGSLIRWRRSRRLVLGLVNKYRPDVVHLNSVVLVACAQALLRAQVPFVWHVRESPVHGYLGLRKRFISRILKAAGRSVIFISAADQRAWKCVGTGQIIRNFVDLKIFNPSVDGRATRESFGIGAGSNVVIYLGGLSRLKGIFPFLEAMSLVCQKLPGTRVLMPGSKVDPPRTWQNRLARVVLPILGWGTGVQRIEKLIRRFGLRSSLIRLPFQENIVPLLAASDVLVFPAMQPHFARPVVEAAAMGKPSVCSRLDGVTELLVDGETGLLFDVGNAKAMATAILRVLQDEEFAHRLGKAGSCLAKTEFNVDCQIKKLQSLYRSTVREFSSDVWER